MSVVTITVKNLNEVKQALAEYPNISKPIVAKAINASLIEIDKEATDDNFQFKTPRGQRTGYLQLSFKYGFVEASENNLKGTIGPAAKYAIFVHEGTSRGIQPNPFMIRIAKKVQPKVSDHFKEALEIITKQIANKI